MDENVKKAVLSAKEKGYKTCVCTNNNAIRLPILIERFNLKNDFDSIVSSHEVGFTKPHKEIFEALLKSVDVKAEELVYSDDNPDRLVGVSDMGIKTFVFEDFSQFLGKLKDFGVLI